MTENHTIIEKSIKLQYIVLIVHSLSIPNLGPLTYNDNGRATLVGVVSGGKDCADRRYPGTYARVTEALPWIQEELAKTC